jgi:hypothetical protein
MAAQPGAPPPPEGGEGSALNPELLGLFETMLSRVLADRNNDRNREGDKSTILSKIRKAVESLKLNYSGDPASKRGIEFTNFARKLEMLSLEFKQLKGPYTAFIDGSEDPVNEEDDDIFLQMLRYATTGSAASQVQLESTKISELKMNPSGTKVLRKLHEWALPKSVGNRAMVVYNLMTFEGRTIPSKADPQEVLTTYVQDVRGYEAMYNDKLPSSVLEAAVFNNLPGSYANLKFDISKLSFDKELGVEELVARVQQFWAGNINSTMRKPTDSDENGGAATGKVAEAKSFAMFMRWQENEKKKEKGKTSLAKNQEVQRHAERQHAETRTCYRCGKPGHIAPKCPNGPAAAPPQVSVPEGGATTGVVSACVLKPPSTVDNASNKYCALSVRLIPHSDTSSDERIGSGKQRPNATDEWQVMTDDEDSGDAPSELKGVFKELLAEFEARFEKMSKAFFDTAARKKLSFHTETRRTVMGAIDKWHKEAKLQAATDAILARKPRGEKRAAEAPDAAESAQVPRGSMVLRIKRKKAAQPAPSVPQVGDDSDDTASDLPELSKEEEEALMEVLDETKYARLNALYDSGANIHLVNDKRHFVEFDAHKVNTWQSASGTEVRSNGSGLVHMWVRDLLTGSPTLLAFEAVYSPNAPHNLVSVGRIEQQYGLFADFKARVVRGNGVQVSLVCTDGTYFLDECMPGPPSDAIFLKAQHTKSVALLSKADNSDRMLKPEVVRDLAWELIGQQEFDVDVFSNDGNAQCKENYTDAFSHSWMGKHFWFNPPFEEHELVVSMFSKIVVSHVRKPGISSYTVCVPEWPTAPWWVTNNADAAKFERVRTFPTGSLLFTAPPVDGGGDQRVPLGPTRWPVVILHLAAELVPVVQASQDVLAHVRLGHCGSHIVPAILDAGTDIGLKLNANARRTAQIISQQCEPCRVAKATRPQAPPTGREGSDEPFATLFVDCHGPMSLGVEGSVYVLGLVDDHSDWALLRPVRSRKAVVLVAAVECAFDEVCRIMQAAGKADGGAESRTFKVIQTDNALEFLGTHWADMCKRHNTLLRHTSHYLHQNNAIVERVWRSVDNGARAMLMSADMPKNMWPYAMVHFGLIRNCLPQTGRLGGKSPFEMIFDRKPDLSRFKAFGAKAYMFLDYDQRAEEPVTGAASYLENLEDGDNANITHSINRRKLADRAKVFRYIGQDESSTAYKLVDMNNPTKIQLAGMVTFDETHIVSKSISNGADLSQSKDYLTSDYNVAKPEGDMLLEKSDEVFVILDHRGYYHQEDNETYAIFYVKSETHPSGIWVDAKVLLEGCPKNATTVQEYLSTYAIAPGCVNPIYPLLTLCEVKQEETRKGGRWKRRDTSPGEWTKCLVVGVTHYPCELNIAVVTLDDAVDWIDVPRSTIRVLAMPQLALSAKEIELATTGQVATEPKSARKALHAPDAPEWIASMDKEVSQLISKGTFLFVKTEDLPVGATPIPSSMKLKLKVGKDGVVKERKSRLVADGSHQQYMIDYEATFAPASQLVSVRILLTIAVCQDLTVYHADVAGAFLNAELKEDVYVKLPEALPECIKDKLPSMTVKLVKSLYGLKQAASDWHECQERLIMGVPGMRRSEIDPCWYYVFEKDLVVHILVHVDDYIIATNSKAWKNWFVNDYFASQYEIRDLGLLDHVVGIGVEWGDKCVALTRTNAIMDTVDRFGLRHGKTLKYPIDKGFSLPKAEVCDKSLKYLNASGELRYHERSCRPDMSLMLAKVSPYAAAHDHRHMDAMLNGVRYMKGTSDMPLIIRKNSRGETKSYHLTMFTDATWGSELGGRSMSGYVIFMNGNNVACASKRQDCVTMSSTEAEIVAVSEGCKDLLHVYQILKDLVHVQLPIKVMIDNQATIALLENQVNNRRSKYIDIRHLWVREHVKSGVLSLHYVRTDENVADYLTKPLTGEKFEYFRAQLMGHI